MEKNKEAKEKKIFIISRKWSSNRGKMTSIERFCSMIDETFDEYHGKMMKLNNKLALILKNKSSSSLTKTGTAYTSYSAKLELYGLINSFKQKSKIIFYPYADYDYNYLGYLKILHRKKIVLWTYFSVEELTNRFKNLNHFETADLILVAGKDQFNYLKSKLNKPKLVYFPIGVDTEYFKPSTSYNNYQIVFSGANRRDFDTAIKAFDIIYKEFKELKVYFIGCHNSSAAIEKRDYIEICQHLSDDDMLKIYQQSHLQVLTLLDGGSSNSLLEGYACGIPVICTELLNIVDYLVDNHVLKIKKEDYVDLSHKIMQIFLDNQLRQKLSIECLNKSKEYGWLEIKAKFISEIKKLD
jgi:glycosyltransferase involved in cell wall biosynthesis